MTKLEEYLDTAELSISNYDAASATHSEAMDALTALLKERPTQKMAALVRLCAQTHPITQKNYSVSQAEDVLCLDAGYSAYKARVAEAEAAAREAEDAKVSCRLLAEARTHAVRAAGVIEASV